MYRSTKREIFSKNEGFEIYQEGAGSECRRSLKSDTECLDFPRDRFQLQFFLRHEVLNQIAWLLVKLGIRDRVEIVLYAYSDPATYHRITTEILNKTAKTPQAQTPRGKQKAG